MIDYKSFKEHFVNSLKRKKLTFKLCFNLLHIIFKDNMCQLNKLYYLY